MFASGSADVNVYVDVNGQWVSGDRGSQIVWNFDSVHTESASDKLKKWEIKRQNELLVSEFADRSEWGTLHFVAPKVWMAFMEYSVARMSTDYIYDSRTCVMSLAYLQWCETISLGLEPSKTH